LEKRKFINKKKGGGGGEILKPKFYFHPNKNTSILKKLLW